MLSRSTKITAKLQTLLSSVKVLSCLFIVSLGVWRLIKTGKKVYILMCVHFSIEYNMIYSRMYACSSIPTGEFHEDSRYPFAGSHLDTAEDFGALALALYAVLWTYDGWYVSRVQHALVCYTYMQLEHRGTVIMMKYVIHVHLISQLDFQCSCDSCVHVGVSINITYDLALVSCILL